MGERGKEKLVYKIPVDKNGNYLASFKNYPDEVFNLRANGTLITNVKHPELEEQDIMPVTWDEDSMRVVKKAPKAPIVPKKEEEPEEAAPKEETSEEKEVTPEGGYVCKCGKKYTSKDWYDKHVKKCESK